MWNDYILLVQRGIKTHTHTYTEKLIGGWTLI